MDHGRAFMRWDSEAFFPIICKQAGLRIENPYNEWDRNLTAAVK